MRLLLLAALLLLPAPGRAALPKEFESSSLNLSGVLYLKAAPAYAPLSPDEKVSSVEKAAGSLAVADGTVVVQSGAVGEIWSVRGGKAEKLDGWSDTTLPLNPKTNNAGRWFASFGLVTGLNIYLPRGTFDITLNLQEKGVCGLLAGYTIFITR